jgi:4-carboxymuconolactone decarboxylase
MAALVVVIGTAAFMGPLAGSAAAPAQRNAGESAAALPKDIHPDSLARLPKVKREDLDAEGKRVFDQLVNPNSDGLSGPIGMWIHSPPMAEHLFANNTYLRSKTQFDQRLTELAILVTARELDQQYVWTSHEPPALKAGLEPDIIDVVRYRRNTTGLGDTEAVIIQFGRELFGKHKVASDTFATALATFGKQGVTNLSGLMGFYSWVSTTINTFDVTPPPGRKPLLPMP